jgi:hypothetical protein
MRTGIDRIRHLIAPNAGGAPDIAVTMAAIHAAAIISKKARNLYQTIRIMSQKGHTLYPIEENPDLLFLAVTQVCVNGKEIKPSASRPCRTTSIECRDCCDGYQYFPTDSDRKYYVESNGRGNKLLHIFPAPDESVDDGIEVQYSYSIKPDACNIPDEIIDLYSHVIVDGALWYVLGQTNEKWYNPTQSRVHKQLFDNGISSARALRNTPYQPGTAEFDWRQGMHV